MDKKIYLTPEMKAPDFSCPTGDGNNFTLSKNRDKNIVLYFYPRDNTPGCTIQAQSLRDNIEEITKLNGMIIGISRDSVEKHEKFCERYSLPFILGSDESGKICQLYGVLTEKSLFGRKYTGITRSTFIIDMDGIIKQAWYGVAVLGHSDNVITSLKKIMHS